MNLKALVAEETNNNHPANETIRGLDLLKELVVDGSDEVAVEEPPVIPPPVEPTPVVPVTPPVVETEQVKPLIGCILDIRPSHVIVVLRDGITYLVVNSGIPEGVKLVVGDMVKGHMGEIAHDRRRGVKRPVFVIDEVQDDSCTRSAKAFRTEMENTLAFSGHVVYTEAEFLAKMILPFIEDGIDSPGLEACIFEQKEQVKVGIINLEGGGLGYVFEK